MSVFGGDSWAPEAQLRKRRVDDLMLSSSSSSYKRLTNGKFACLVCPHNPVLDSPLSLSMHMKGSRHIAAQTRLKEKELSRQEELSKRIALSSDSKDFPNSNISFSKLKGSMVQTKPLMEKTRKAVLATECLIVRGQNVNDSCNPNIAMASNTVNGHYIRSIPSHPSHQIQSTCSMVSSNQRENIAERISVVDSMEVSDCNTELRKRHEKELQFTAAGWKRDGHGKWYKDENVEFDSDDEDPNVCLG